VHGRQLCERHPLGDIDPQLTAVDQGHQPRQLSGVAGDEDVDGTDAAVRTDAEIHDCLQNTITSYYHPVGTCRIGTDDMSVVDPQPKVHGIEHLRVADASVMPSLPSGNTNATVLAMAERAADLLRTEPLPERSEPAFTPAAAPLA
jgi:choline dehydrogenase-like flavoprotein